MSLAVPTDPLGVSVTARYAEAPNVPPSRVSRLDPLRLEICGIAPVKRGVVGVLVGGPLDLARPAAVGGGLGPVHDRRVPLEDRVPRTAPHRDRRGGHSPGVTDHDAL